MKKKLSSDTPKSSLKQNTSKKPSKAITEADVIQWFQEIIEDGKTAAIQQSIPADDAIAHASVFDTKSKSAMPLSGILSDGKNKMQRRQQRPKGTVAFKSDNPEDEQTNQQQNNMLQQHLHQQEKQYDPSDDNSTKIAGPQQQFLQQDFGFSEMADKQITQAVVNGGSATTVAGAVYSEGRIEESKSSHYSGNVDSRGHGVEIVVGDEDDSAETFQEYRKTVSIQNQESVDTFYPSGSIKKVSHVSLHSNFEGKQSSEMPISDVPSLKGLNNKQTLHLTSTFQRKQNAEQLNKIGGTQRKLPTLPIQESQQMERQMSQDLQRQVLSADGDPNGLSNKFSNEKFRTLENNVSDLKAKHSQRANEIISSEPGSQSSISPDYFKQVNAQHDGKSMIERKLMDYDRQLELNLRDVHKNIITHNVYMKRNDKILKNKLAFQVKYDKQQLTRQFRQEQDQHRQQIKKHDQEHDRKKVISPIASISHNKPPILQNQSRQKNSVKYQTLSKKKLAPNNKNTADHLKNTLSTNSSFENMLSPPAMAKGITTKSNKGKLKKMKVSSSTRSIHTKNNLLFQHQKGKSLLTREQQLIFSEPNLHAPKNQGNSGNNHKLLQQQVQLNKDLSRQPQINKFMSHKSLKRSQIDVYQRSMDHLNKLTTNNENTVTKATSRAFSSPRLLSGNHQSQSHRNIQNQLDIKSHRHYHRRRNNSGKLSLIQDLNENPIVIPKAEQNQKLRAVMSRQSVGSLPKNLKFKYSYKCKDAEGNEIIKQDVDENQSVPCTESMEKETQQQFTQAVEEQEHSSQLCGYGKHIKHDKHQRIMRLSSATKKENGYLTQLQSLIQTDTNMTRLESKNYSAKVIRQSNNANMKATTSTITGTEKGTTKSSFAKDGIEFPPVLTKEIDLKVLTRKAKKKVHRSLQNEIDWIVSKEYMSENLNKMILNKLSDPEMGKYPDFFKTHFKEFGNQSKTFLYECKGKIKTLESRSSKTDHVRNSNIECLPRLSILCKVVIKDRVAPLRLKFEFFDIETGEEIKRPDTVVCISSTIPNPTPKNCQWTKQSGEKYMYIDPWKKDSFSHHQQVPNSQNCYPWNPSTLPLKKDVQSAFRREIINRTGEDEKHHSQHKPSSGVVSSDLKQVYISLTSISGCMCTITVHFPREKTALASRKHMQQVSNMQLEIRQQVSITREKSSTNTGMTLSEDFLNEFKMIDQTAYQQGSKIKKGEVYKMKKKFIQNEIQRCNDFHTQSAVLLQSQILKKEKRKRRLHEKEQQEKERKSNDIKSLVHYIHRQNTLSQTQSLKKNEFLKNSLLVLEAAQYEAQTDRPESKEHQMVRQKVKRELMYQQAKELRLVNYEEKQKLRQLYVVKQDLLKAYRSKSKRTTEKQMDLNNVASQWARLLKVFPVIKEFYKKCTKRISLKIRAEKYLNSSLLVQRRAKRYFTNDFGGWGKTLRERHQIKISHSIFPLYYFKRDMAEETAKYHLQLFFQKTSLQYSIKEKYLFKKRAAIRLQRNWRQWKFRFVVREMILQASMALSIKGWQEMASLASTGQKTQLILIQEKLEMMLCAEEEDYYDIETDQTKKRFKHHEAEKRPIFQKNFTLFSKMIKYEGLIRSAHARIELATVEAVRMYAGIEAEVEQLKFQDPNFIDEGIDTEECDYDEKNTQEETKKSPTKNKNNTQQLKQAAQKQQQQHICKKHQVKEPRNNHSSASNDSTNMVDVKDEAIQPFVSQNSRERIKQQRIILKKKLKRIEKFRKFTKQMIIQQENVMKDVMKLESDPFNQAVVCWKDLEGYEELKKNAKSYCKKNRQNAKSKDKQAKQLFKSAKEKHSKAQAAIVKKQFKLWCDRRRDDFQKKLKWSLQPLDLQQVKKEYNDNIHALLTIPVDNFIQEGRVNQPEEVAFMFLKCADEINKEISKKKKKEKKALK